MRSGKRHNMENQASKKEEENSINIDTVLLPHRSSTGATTIDDPDVDNTTQKQRGGITGKGFLPGKSGNPDGRPRGTRNISTKMREALDKLGAKDAQGKPVPVEDALVQKVIKMALDGDRKMIELIWNYLDGKPPQYIDITSHGERVGTVLITPEEEKRIEELFAPRLLLPQTQHGNNQLPTKESNDSNNQGRNPIPEKQQSGSAYESNS